MITSVNDWVSFLRGSDVLIGVPLLIGGAALMFFGWRMWKPCVVVSFGVLGVAVGTTLADPGPKQLLCAVGCGALLALLSYRPVNHALALLGGLVGGGFVMSVLTGVGLHGPPLWIGGGVALFACSALAFLNRQFVVIAVTSFLGAVLLISGATVLVMSSPGLYSSFHSMASGSVIVLPFLLLVPAVMSAFYQVSEVRRANAEL